MSFTANASGGSYSHSHIYGIKVNEYYGSNANITKYVNQMVHGKINLISKDGRICHF